ncbi:MAG: hypothetical protein LAO55_15625 [Acidobacteriia bacterium]|nr:hypothetical protein [Terriglobia bacterium]
MRYVMIAAVSAALTLAPAFAQWQNLKTPGIPRTKDGKADLNAPAPKLPDGKPDLSGIWNPNPKYLRNIAVDLGTADLPMRPWAQELFNVRSTGALSHLEPDANCLPQGVPKIDTAPAPWKLVQFPGQVVILYEAFTQFRQIFTDGRKLPEDPNPSWLGYSVGRWDGDTLVVESNGFNGKIWLDQLGHPSTEQMRVTERFRRKDFGHMEIKVTVDDPAAYTMPWNVTYESTLMADGELLEFICGENEQDIKHLAPKSP